MIGIPQFDPDKLYLTKEQLERIGHRLIAGWRRTGKAGNEKAVLMTKTMIFLMKRTSEQNVQQYYRDFFREAFAVMQENVLVGSPELKMLNQVQQQKNIDVITKAEKFDSKSMLQKVKAGMRLA